MWRNGVVCVFYDYCGVSGVDPAAWRRVSDTSISPVHSSNFFIQVRYTRPVRESPNGSFPILAPLACPPHKSFVQRKEGSTRRVRITSSRRRMCQLCVKLEPKCPGARADFGEICRGCPPDDPDGETPLESFTTPAFRNTRHGKGQLSSSQEGTKEVEPRRAVDEKQPSGNPSTAPHPAARVKMPQ